MYKYELVKLLEKVLYPSYEMKNGEHAFHCPFCNHHKKKLQVNFETQKWHCWVSNTGGRNLFQLFKRVNASREQFNELVELVGEPKYSRVKKQDKKDLVRLPDEYKPLWNERWGTCFPLSFL